MTIVFNYKITDLISVLLIECVSTVRVSMLEIYNDECRDLLHPEIPSRDIALREDKEGRMFFTGAREEIVTDKKVCRADVIYDSPL